MRRSIVIRIVVLGLAVTALSVPSAWADHVPAQSAGQSSAAERLIVPVLHSTEHGSPSSTNGPLIVPVRPSSEHGGTVAVSPPVVILGTSSGFDWTSAGIGAFSAFGLALILLGAVTVRGRRTRVA
jgi:hypothetical protein